MLCPDTAWHAGEAQSTEGSTKINGGAELIMGSTESNNTQPTTCSMTQNNEDDNRQHKHPKTPATSTQAGSATVQTLGTAVLPMYANTAAAHTAPHPNKNTNFSYHSSHDTLRMHSPCWLYWQLPGLLHAALSSCCQHSRTIRVRRKHPHQKLGQQPECWHQKKHSQQQHATTATTHTPCLQ